MILDSEDGARTYVERLCDGISLQRLEILIEELAAENRKQNLIAEKSLNVVWQRHIADSAQLAEHIVSPNSGCWLDLGSGAGFPGLVIAAMYPETPVVLVESRRRRVEWLESAIDKMDLPNCTVEGQRLEQLEAFPASVVSARAFAPLDRLLRLSARFSTDDTRWVLPKGRSAAQEVDALPKELRSMFHVEQSQTSSEAGIVVGQGKVEMRT